MNARMTPEEPVPDGEVVSVNAISNYIALSLTLLEAEFAVTNNDRDPASRAINGLQIAYLSGRMQELVEFQKQFVGNDSTGVEA